MADVYILLLYYYQAESLSIPMKMKSTQKGRAFIDIAATVRKLGDLVLARVATFPCTDWK